MQSGADETVPVDQGDPQHETDRIAFLRRHQVKLTDHRRVLNVKKVPQMRDHFFRAFAATIVLATPA